MFGVLSSGFSIKTALDIGDLFPKWLFLSRLDYKKEKQGPPKSLLKILTDIGSSYSFSHLWQPDNIENQTNTVMLADIQAEDKGLIWGLP